MAGGADDHRTVNLPGIVKNIRHSGMMGKVDQHICMYFAQLGKGLGNTVFSVNADASYHFFAQNAVDQFAHGAVGAADNGSHYRAPSFLISLYSTARVVSSMGVRGRRR